MIFCTQIMSTHHHHILDEVKNCISYHFHNFKAHSFTYLDWKRSSGWLESWEGLLLVTDVSTTCSEAIFRVKCLLTLKLASAQVVETSVTNNSPYKNSNHPDDLFQSRHVTPGFKPFSYFLSLTLQLMPYPRMSRNRASSPNKITDI